MKTRKSMLITGFFKRRKILSLMLALVLVSVAANVAPMHVHAIADSCTDGYDHNWIVFENPPTCTWAGMREDQCTKCYENRNYREIPPLGHSYSAAVTREASCTAAGERKYTCSRCGDSYTESIPATGHDYHTEITKAATCTEAGTQTDTCARCGDKKTTAIPAAGHGWDNGTVTKSPTCTATGTKTIKCTRCGETKTESIPATGHDYHSVVTKAATCTEAGTQTETCSRCGDKKTTTTPALGHDWEETVTAPAGLTDGAVTRTCRRCYETETTPIPAASSLFNSVRNGSSVPIGVDFSWLDATDLDLSNVLHVTQQPEGGMIPANGSFTLTTAVEGGVAPYTYEWHRVRNLDVPEVLLQIAANEFISSYNSSKTGFAAAFHDAYEKQNGFADTIDRQFTAYPVESTFSFGSSMYHKGLEPVKYDLNDHSLGTGDSPDYPATASGTYYCVIKDSAGNWTSTEDVEVTRGLYIVTQPQNTNMGGTGSAIITCTAAGGTPFGAEFESAYVYYWFDAQGNNIGDEQQIEVSQEGEYYCKVEDAELEQVTSESCMVYSAEPLTVTISKDVCLVDDPEDVHEEIGFTVSGGVLPYVVEISRNGGDYGGLSIDAGMMTDGVYIDTRTLTETGTYFYMVTDAMGETRTATCSVEQKHLRISASGTFGDKFGAIVFHVSVKDGLPPYTYTLYHGDENVGQSEESETENRGFTVRDTGVYRIHVEDARGDTDETESVKIVVGDGKPIITRQPEVERTEYPGNGQYSAQLICTAVSATGEDGNIWYEWQRRADDKRAWRKDLGNAEFLPVQEPGTYRCQVTDRETGESTISDTVTVDFKPVITRQPESIEFEYQEDGQYSVPLVCEAVAANGDSSNLSYEWETYLINSSRWECFYRTWKTSGSQPMRESDFQNFHSFRCKVTDKATGEYVYSDIATASVELNCTVKFVRDDGGVYHFYDIMMNGGSAPYTIQEYLLVPADYDPDTYYFFNSEHTEVLVKTEKTEKSIYRLKKTGYQTVTYEKNGQTYQDTIFAYYKVVVTDANGNVFSKIIPG